MFGIQKRRDPGQRSQFEGPKRQRNFTCTPSFFVDFGLGFDSIHKGRNIDPGEYRETAGLSLQRRYNVHDIIAV